jgi:hypothetical protein
MKTPSTTVTILRADLEAIIGFLEGFDFDDDHNAEYVREYLPRLRAAATAEDELKAIHDVIMCIGCVTEAPETDPYTLRAVKQMALRINILESKLKARRMRGVNIEVWKFEDGGDYKCQVSIAPCPHCMGHALIVTEIERSGYPPNEWPFAVKCATCGAHGPWGGDEYSAVKIWNKCLHVETIKSEWIKVECSGEAEDDDDVPF